MAAGANPILKGSTLLSTSGYTLGPNTTTHDFFAAAIRGRPARTARRATGASKSRMLDITNPRGADHDQRDGFAHRGAEHHRRGDRSGRDSCRTPARSRAITWGGGNNGTTVAAGTTATSDQITLQFG